MCMSRLSVIDSPRLGKTVRLLLSFHAARHLITRREKYDLTFFLYINLLKPNGYICTTDFNILILCITPTKRICKFDMILTINSCYFPK
jgi:hypothetical protein